jgi:hypothetical protein
MAAKKSKQGNTDSSNGKSKGAAKDTKGSESSSSSLASLSLPGLIAAMAAAFVYPVYRSQTISYSTDSSVPSQHHSSSSYSSRQLISPSPGSWTDGFYTTIPTQAEPSTHALLYDNGGIGTPTPVSFLTDDEFLSLGRLYNDLGQIVQSPTHFPNNTALYRGPTAPGTHFQYPAVSVGYNRPIPGLYGGSGKQITLETLTLPSSTSSTSDPRVFYVHNFLSEEEADAFVKFSTAEENPYKMAYSTGGTHKAWNQGGENARLSTRTSMNAVSYCFLGVCLCLMFVGYCV